MEKLLFDSTRKINFRLMEINKPRDVVQYSFIAQRTICYLDLSVCEYFRNEKLVFTMESFRKLIESERKILYNYHVDESKDLLDCHFENIAQGKKFLRSFPSPPFHFGQLVVSHSVYTANLEGIISNKVENSADKLEEIRALVNPVRFLRFSPNQLKIMCQCFFNVIYDGSCDTSLLQDCIQVFNFVALNYALCEAKTNLLTDILKQSQSFHTDFFKNWCIRDILHRFLFSGGFDTTSTLVEYGYSPQFQEDDIALMQYGFPVEFAEELSYNSRAICRRGLLLMQLISKYSSSSDYEINGHVTALVGKELQLIWNSIQDPYLSYQEIVREMVKYEFYADEFLEDTFKFYKSSVCEERYSETPTPRSLCHLSRICIRETLKKCWRLPHGIVSLPLPCRLKDYVNLELIYCC